MASLDHPPRTAPDVLPRERRPGPRVRPVKESLLLGTWSLGVWLAAVGVPPTEPLVTKRANQLQRPPLLPRHPTLDHAIVLDREFWAMMDEGEN